MPVKYDLLNALKHKRRLSMQAQANWENQLLALAGQVHHPSIRPFFSYWAGDASLRKAYKQAEIITAEHSKSFHLASGLLPEEKRSAVRALYAFCRTVDDIVDEVEAKKDRDFELNYWRTIVQTASSPTDDLIAAAWADTLTRYHIPRHYALQLIDGVARDLSQTRYQTFDDLATYCYGVASTVGLMSMYIVGFKSHEAVPYAIKLGVATRIRARANTPYISARRCNSPTSCAMWARIIATDVSIFHERNLSFTESPKPTLPKAA